MRKYGFLILVVLINIAAVSAEAYYENGLPAYPDKNPPNSYMESIYGWYNHAVMARLTAYDGHSGIAALSYRIDGSLPDVSYTASAELNLTTEGLHRIEYSSMDNAGNTEVPKRSLVKLDLTAPEISVTSPDSRTYLHSDIIALDFSGTDALSGIFSISGKINGAPVARLQEFDMLTLAPGIYEFKVIALDNAGNTGFSKVNFTVISSIDSLMAINNRAILEGWVSDADTAGSLSQKLIFTKEMIEAGQKEKANNLLKSYINEIASMRDRTLSGHAADILTNEAAYVYILNF